MPGELVGAFQDFFSESKRKQTLLDAAAAFPNERSIAIEFSELERFDPRVADALLEHPDDVAKDAETAVSDFVLPTPSGKKFAPHVRFHSLPDSSEVEPRELGAANLNRLFKIEGVVSYIMEIKPMIKTALWECLHCGATTKTLTQKNVVAEPGSCRCGHGGKENFKLLEQSSDFINIQKAGIQEAVEKIRGSTPASRIELWMEDDLVNRIAPGDKVWITGVMRLKQQKPGKGQSSVYDKFVDVTHIQKIEREFEEIKYSKEEEQKIRELAADPRIYEKIQNSIAPSMYGYNEMKQAVALQLFGGNSHKQLPDGKRVRSDLHVLLIGDPGTGKSMLLESVARIAPKNVYVSGGGASGVGMTASAERNTEGEWLLKAGAMVLANGGIAIIDEFDKMCLSGDSLVYLGSGEIKPIEEVFDEAKKEFGANEEKGVEAVKTNIPVLTQRKGKIVIGKAVAVTRRKTGEPLYEIVLRSGKRLKATANHPFLLLNENGEFEYKRVREIKEGTFAVCPHKIPSPEKTIQKIDSFKGKFTKTASPEIFVEEEFGSLMGYLTSEGCAPANPFHGSYRVDFVNYSPEVSANYWRLAENLDLNPKTPPSMPHNIRINSKNFVEVMKTVSPTLSKGARNKRAPSCVMKAGDEIVAAFLSAFADGDGGTYRNPRSVCFFSTSIVLIRQLQGLLLRFGAISKITENAKKGYGPCYRLLVQGNSLKLLSGHLKFAQEKKRKTLAENEAATLNKKRFASLDTVPNTGAIIKSARKKLGVYGYALGLSRGTLSVFERGLNKPSKEALKKIVAALKKANRLKRGAADEEIDKLEFLAECDLQFEEVSSLKEIPGEKFVYNLSVEGDKNFIANGVIVHNSDEDRGLMHEAMEQQFVSIAKAGMITQFKSAASVLAAANPKMGRFDSMKPPGEQFAMGPALMSRFDLIFAIRDFPDETRDRGLVEHVLSSHKLASENKAPEEGSPINPEIEAELLQKYIAYARQNVFPILTDAAIKKIEEYYIQLRKLGEKQGNVPVTPRQLEGLVRLSEASAKIRLSDKVEASDADRAVTIVNFVLEEIFVDKETGRIDSDVINIGQSKSRIDKMRSLLGIISELEKKTDLVAIEDVFREAAQYGMDEVYVRQLVETLERQGDLYRPKAGHVKSARKRDW